ncbi:hypothetical protein ACFX15_033136 [Malus domestica]
MRRDMMGWNMSKDALGWKQEGRRRRQRCYNFMFHGCGTSRFRERGRTKIHQNSFRGTAHSTHFRRTKRETKRFVPLHFVPSTYQRVPKRLAQQDERGV